MAATPMTAAMVTAALEATASMIKPKDADPFRKGDTVVYPAHGVGRIDHVGIEDIAGHKLHLIHISFAENQMTLRVPVAQARAAGLRKLASRKQLADALAKLSGRPRISRLMWAKRAQDYLGKINSGELGALAEVVRDLQAAGDGSGAASANAICSNWRSIVLAPSVAAINRISKVEATEQLHRSWSRQGSVGRAEQHRASVP